MSCLLNELISDQINKWINESQSLWENLWFQHIYAYYLFLVPNAIHSSLKAVQQPSFEHHKFKILKNLYKQRSGLPIYCWKNIHMAK